jgi:hypothetical protein
MGGSIPMAIPIPIPNAEPVIPSKARHSSVDE